MDLIIYLGLLFIICIVAANANVKQKSELHNKSLNTRTKTMEDHLSKINNFSATQKIIGFGSTSMLAIDEHTHKVCLVSCQLNDASSNLISYKDILTLEIFENGVAVTKTVRSSQIASALIGGLALGGIGVIVGGLSGKKQLSETVNKIDIRLIINNTNSPLFDLNFLAVETNKNEALYKQVMERTRHCYGLIKIIMHQADIEENASRTESVNIIDSTIKS